MGLMPGPGVGEGSDTRGCGRGSAAADAAAVAKAFDDLGGWSGVLGRLWSGGDLSRGEAALTLSEILAGRANASQIASFLTALRIKGETVEEMSGLVSAMFDAAEPLVVGGDLIDTCGTGGDKTGTINVSTLAALVVAGAGSRVCKHGNRAASSAAGSADVLEALGVAIDLDSAGVARCIEEAGMGFCFAQRFHPAMRHVGPVRKDLGVATVFNFMGPLANPARARYQVVGVSDPGMAERMIAVLGANGCKRAMVVYGHDGLDELSTTSTSTVLDLVPGDGAGVDVRTYEVDPSSLGLKKVELRDLRGGDARVNADLACRVLDGDRGPHREVVALNAAAALMVGGKAADLPEGLALAAAAIDDGSAAEVLEQLISVSRTASSDRPASPASG